MTESILSGWGRIRPREYPVEYWKGGPPGPGFPEHRIHCRGMGRSYGDASLPAGSHAAFDTTLSSRFLSFDPQTGILSAEPGATLEEILRCFIPKGWFLPVTPGTMFVSLGGAVASNVHGKNHHVAGSIENFIEEIEVATPKGTFACSRASRPDLFRATVGGYGLTGLITRVDLKLRRIESSWIESRNFKARTLSEMFSLFDRHDRDYEFSVAWIDSLASGRHGGRGVAMFGNHATAPVLTGKSAEQPLRLSQKAKFAVPLEMPGFFLNRTFLKAFNSAFYLAGRGEGAGLVDYEGYFYPLDRILDWNKMYGRAGFLQYQFVIPDPRGEEGIAKCLEFMGKVRIGSFLTVLKRCGDDHAMLPFCRKGYTLALDIPFRGEETLIALDKLDEMVLGFGGRVYLTKDGRIRPAMFRAMYPELREWMDIVKEYNPNRVFWSALAERLEL